MSEGFSQGAVHPDDWDMFSDAVFLITHPGWTWRDLQDTPAEVIEIIQRYDASAPKGK